jgi:hypothetical protein
MVMDGGGELSGGVVDDGDADRGLPVLNFRWWRTGGSWGSLWEQQLSQRTMGDY